MRREEFKQLYPDWLMMGNSHAELKCSGKDASFINEGLMVEVPSRVSAPMQSFDLLYNKPIKLPTTVQKKDIFLVAELTAAASGNVGGWHVGKTFKMEDHKM